MLLKCVIIGQHNEVCVFGSVQAKGAEGGGGRQARGVAAVCSVLFGCLSLLLLRRLVFLFFS